MPRGARLRPAGEPSPGSIQGGPPLTLVPLRIGHADRAWHEAFFAHVESVFPGVDFRPWAARGGWKAGYDVLAFAEGPEIVASIGRTRMRLVIGGGIVDGWQLGAVSTRPAHRGRGLSRRLMQTVLAELEHPDEPVILFANPRVLDFYPLFGFARIDQHRFTAPADIVPAARAAPLLDIDRPADRARLDAIAGRAAAVNGRFAAVGYADILLWHLCDRPMRVHHLETFDAAAVVSEEDGLLTLHDLLAPRPFPLARALPLLATGPAREVAFGFDPGAWWPGATASGPDPDSYLFLRGGPAPGPGPLRFPDLAQT